MKIKVKNLVTLVIAALVLGVGVARMVSLRQYSPDHLRQPSPMSEQQVKAEAHKKWLQARAQLPAPIRKGEPLSLPDGAFFQLASFSPSGSKIASLYGSKSDSGQFQSFVRIEGTNEKAAKVFTARDLLKDGQFYSLNWLSEDSMAVCLNTNPQPERSADYRYRLLVLNVANMEVVADSGDQLGHPYVLGSLNGSLYVVDNCNDNATWTFRTLSADVKNIEASYDWQPWSSRDGSVNLSSLGKRTSIHIEQMRQRPNTSKISMLVEVSDEGKSNAFLFFDMSSHKFVRGEAGIDEFAKAHKVSSFAWTSNGVELWCAVRGDGIYSINSGASRSRLSIDAPARIDSVSAAKLILVGSKDLGRFVTNGEAEKRWNDLTRPFLVSIES